MGDFPQRVWGFWHGWTTRAAIVGAQGLKRALARLLLLVHHGGAVPLELSRMIDDLVGRAWSLARQRSGRLAALSVALPGPTQPQWITEELDRRLTEAGLPGVEIEVQYGAEAPKLLVVEFERWRA